MYFWIYIRMDWELKDKQRMDKKTDLAIRQFLLAAAKQNPELVKAYVFGSYAKSSDRHESDIDIAIIIDNLSDSDKFDMQVKLMLLAAKFDSRIEPHPLSKEDFNLNNPFVSEIKKTGIEIPV